MRVEQWMTMDVTTVRPRDSVAHARALLEERRINQLPVVVNGRLVGIVTDRDLRDAVSSAISATAEATGARPQPVGPESIPVEAVMSAKAFFVRPGDPMEKAAALMRRERIGALPVLEGKALRGIITRSDVLRAFIHLAAEQRKAMGKRAAERPSPPPGARARSRPATRRRVRPAAKKAGRRR
ncbi:MAG TPA: CBS domain-containing protein [Candidatus Binataceae bacterium]|nr:CBS domain-containing protein [Candidatus Binataceae bacterium]